MHYTLACNSDHQHNPSNESVSNLVWFSVVAETELHRRARDLAKSQWENSRFYAVTMQLLVHGYY